MTLSAERHGGAPRMAEASSSSLGMRSRLLATKVKTYSWLVKTSPDFVHPGFKLFFDEDTQGGHKLMPPKDVMALTPVPEYVMYE